MANAIILKPLTVTPLNASSTALGAVANMANDYAGVIWQSTVEANPAFTIDLGADTLIDTIMLFGLELAPTATMVRVLGSTAAAGSGFGSPTATDGPVALYAGSAVPTNGKGVFYWTAPAGWPAVRYLMIQGQTGSGSYALRVSRFVVGKRIQLSRNFGFGAALGVRDLGALDFSRRGVLLRTRGVRLRTVSLTFSSIRKDEAEAQVRPLLEQIGNTDMVALCTDPTADTQRQNRCSYGPLVGDVQLKWRNAVAWEAGLNQVSIF